MPKRVLIVDDALIMRRRIRKIAEQAGWLVVGEAHDGEEAVAAFQLHQPDLVTMDIVMPKQNGVQALQRIIDHDPTAQVIMVSAVDQKEKLAECIRCGAIDFIVKPFDATTLRALFEKQLNADPAA